MGAKGIQAVNPVVIQGVGVGTASGTISDEDNTGLVLLAKLRGRHIRAVRFHRKPRMDIVGQHPQSFPHVGLQQGDTLVEVHGFGSSIHEDRDTVLSRELTDTLHNERRHCSFPVVADHDDLDL